MKDRLTDANFPRTADNRVYHLGIRPGEIANRIVTVGSPSRALVIASHLDDIPRKFRLESERGFQTITGRYKGVPVSIISIGMGSPNMDFFVRETRESIAGDMAIIRLGSCGSLSHTAPVGSCVVPIQCVGVTRNVDFDFGNPEDQQEDKAYFISKPVPDDPELHQLVIKALENARPPEDQTPIVGDLVNASADSFYSSQGRLTSFPDHNGHLIEELLQNVESLGTLEMETFHLYHLAKCWNRRLPSSSTGVDLSHPGPPLTTGPVQPVTLPGGTPLSQSTATGSALVTLADSRIHVSAAQMVFAARTSANRDFITPEKVKLIEEWTGKGVLEALITYNIPSERLHPEEGSVWAT
ncbi:nucleoside phosphorylase domain-containing protein [Rhodocollybia butyracea]|uniref:Nucleoside phosphorylase domain-containing protein n=1 Tax=Rhodocollybia butyracea TaxID=206335 RepID=A0A9P5U5R1_9AGAR|nr:nucleoside phosphorylase domain-containing protein [Rhodocollybia butyracea]